jgi:hypothetical protein
VVVQRGEHQTREHLEAHLAQAVIGFAEVFRKVVLARYAAQVAAVVEQPAVVGTLELGRAATHLGHQQGAAVGAGVVEHADFAVFLARDQDRHLADVEGLVVARLRDFAHVRHRVPVRPVEQTLELELINLGAVVEHLRNGVWLGRKNHQVLDELGVGIHAWGSMQQW